MTGARAAPRARAGRPAVALAAAAPLLALSLLGTTGIAARAAPPPPDEGSTTDVIVVVDASGSMARNDPRGTGAAVLKALLDFATGGGGRVSVVRFGGWFDTGENDPLLLTPTTVPDDPAARREVLGKAVTAVGAALEVGARASDWNAAFELAVKKALDAAPPEDDREILALVLSDGVMEVVEGARVREAYLDDARTSTGDDVPDRDALTAAALARFTGQVLPGLPEQLRISVLWPGTAGADESTPVLQSISAAGRGSDEVIRLGEESLSDIIRRLLARGGWQRGARRVFLDAGVGSVDEGAEAVIAVPLLEGMRGARALLIADHPDFDVALSGPAAEGARIFGEGERYRIVELDAAAVAAGRSAADAGATPELPIRVTARRALALERLVSGELRFAASVAASAPGVDAGRPVGAELTVRAAGGAEPLRDPRLAVAGRAAVLAAGSAPGPVTDGAGPMAFAADRAVGTGDLPPGDLAVGTHEVRAAWTVAYVRDGVAPVPIAGGGATGSVSIRAVGEASFTDAAAGGVGDPLALAVSVTAGRLEAPSISIAASGPGGESVAVTLARAGDGAYRGTFTPDAPGAWTLGAQELPEPPLRIEAGTRASVEVVHPIGDVFVQLVAILDDAGATRDVDALAVTVLAAPGEKARARFQAIAGGAIGARCIGAEVRPAGVGAGGPSISGTVLDARHDATGALNATVQTTVGTVPERADTGPFAPGGLELVVTAEVHGQSRQFTFPVGVRYELPPPGLDPRILIGAGIGLILLLALLVVALRKKPAPDEPVDEAPGAEVVESEITRAKREASEVARAQAERVAAERAEAERRAAAEAEERARAEAERAEAERRAAAEAEERARAAAAAADSDDDQEVDLDAELARAEPGEVGDDSEPGEAIFVVFEEESRRVRRAETAPLVKSHDELSIASDSDDESRGDSDDLVEPDSDIRSPLDSDSEDIPENETLAARRKRLASRRLTDMDLPIPTESDRLDAVDSDEIPIPAPSESLRIDPNNPSRRLSADEHKIRDAALESDDDVDFEELFRSTVEGDDEDD